MATVKFRIYSAAVRTKHRFDSEPRQVAMATDSSERVRTALESLQFKPDEIHLELTRSGSVGGHIVSASFTGQSQMERQEQLWKGLKNQLRPDELVKIVALLTMTPEEIADD